ncbi:MAG: ribosome-associated translation inhibitor RaiA [Planctomycetaceae bacterium]
MQVAITCRHGSINDDIRAYITRKSEKLLNHFARVTEIDVTVDFESDRVSVEILLDAEHKHNFVASVESTGDVIPVFDAVLHKMDRQIRRYKGKIQDHRRDRPTHELTKDSSVDE